MLQYFENLRDIVARVEGIAEARIRTYTSAELGYGVGGPDHYDILFHKNEKTFSLAVHGKEFDVFEEFHNDEGTFLMRDKGAFTRRTIIPALETNL